MAREIVVEKVTSTAITDDLQDNWLECINALEQMLKDKYAYIGYWDEEIERIKEFLEEFKLDSERKIAVNVIDKEPRACGSCHMLGSDYDLDDKLVGWACVYENGPHFPFGKTDMPATHTSSQWFKVCEYYIRRAD